MLFLSGRRPDCSGDHHRRVDYGMGQPWRDRVGVSDGTRRRNGSGGVHVDGAIRGDGVRGDGVGVGDVVALFGRTRHSGHAAGGDDSWESSWKSFVHYFVRWVYSLWCY